MTKENREITLPVYRVDAFINPYSSHSGNPAAVVILKEWLPDETLLSIAGEIDLSETAFLVGRQLRWFTPRLEVNLCGHATLATAFVLFNHLSVTAPLIEFETRSGKLTVRRQDKGYTLDFPATAYRHDETAPKQDIEDALGTTVSELFVTHDRYICIVDSFEQVSMSRFDVETQHFERNDPNFDKIAALPLPGLIITARVTDKDDFDDVDFVSRYFAPAKGVPEDPVTGTSHCVLAPLWGQRLGKTQLKARQISARGGDIFCDWQGDRVSLTGQARTVSSGTVTIKGDKVAIRLI